ncbi:hypothetical protein Pyrfu_1244 [Pyrolobus fumarii 1A]|uniref:Uncharacterized protein n=1 Tax=Pyrolobus fumarii (strain DSM 11204 / 1A) TaxID=694429 RepID=G0EG02_PYRF1|nr:hypothetical protein [Pyrolobus fumarii]AEM39103.1 hypothetical protein Pyrfu_1244 [Pyrolobus fumarii 1A]
MKRLGYILGLSLILVSAAVLSLYVTSPSREGAVNNAGHGDARAAVVLDLSLVGSSGARVSRPIRYFRLSNGTTIVVEDRNPFPFEIRLEPSVAGMEVPGRLTVYRVEAYRGADEVLELLEKIGVEAKGVRYDNATKTFIYSDERVYVEYETETGFMRIVFREPLDREAVDSILEVLGYREGECGKRVVTTVDVNGTPLEKGVVYYRMFDGLPSNIAVLVRYRGDRVVAVEGVVPKSLVAVGSYQVTPVDELPRLLAERVSGKVDARDWMLDNVAFTNLTITKIQLVYRLTPKGYIVPVYVLEGHYELRYDGINEEGTVKGAIVAVKP